MSRSVLDDLEAATSGQVAAVRTGVGEDWVDNWEPILNQLVEDEVELPEDLRTRFAVEIAGYLDSWVDLDDDELMLWRARENFPKFLSFSPKIEDPRRKTPETA